MPFIFQQVLKHIYMDLQKIQRIVIDALEDIKAHEIKVFNTTHLTSLFDRVIICSATSGRQTRAIASNLIDEIKKHKLDLIAHEGQESGDWVLIDTGHIVVHIMQPETRSYYNLEEIWGDKPVNVKLLPESTIPVSPNSGTTI